MSIAAYKRTIRESESPRQIEARVFARITGSLNQHKDSYDRAPSKEERSRILASGLRNSLSENQKLWVYLRDDLARDDNQLPAQLRAQLISIALWVDRHSNQVMGGSTGLRALIDVNSSILAGLSRSMPQQEVRHGVESHAQAL